MYGVLRAYWARCGWQVQYLLQSPAVGGVSLNECTFTYISKDKTKAENICLMYTGFFISFLGTSGEAKAPWVSSSQSLRECRGKCDWNGKAKMKWIIQGNPVRLLSCPAARETSSKTELWQVKKSIINFPYALSILSLICVWMLVLYRAYRLYNFPLGQLSNFSLFS